jgi:Protein of unknown function (DUF3037)
VAARAPGGGGAGGRVMTGEPQVFEYAVLRVVPRVDRGEIMNAGILLYCRPLRYLGARVALDTDRLLALDPEADLPGVARALAAVSLVCGPDVVGPDLASTGAAGLQEIGRRFRWLTAPRSTVVQPGPVHTGLTADPDAEIDRLLQALVLRPR